MITVEDVHYHYPPVRPGDRPVTALDGISCAVPEGTCLAVIGPNNSGKTTLCLAVAGLAPRLTDGQITGRIVVAGRDVQAELPGALAETVGLVMQDPSGQLFNPTVEDELAWGLENLGIPPAEMRERIEWALAAVGLQDVPRTQPPQTLSGGQQKRLALAAALALGPSVLVLDDPFGGLAPAARREMVGMLRELRARQPLTILLTGNDIETIAALADRVLLLDAGRVVRHGTLHEVYAETDGTPSPAGAFATVVNRERGLRLACVTLEDVVEQTRAFSLNGCSPHAQARQPAINRDQGGEPAVELRGVTFGYDSSRTVLHGIDLVLPQGQFVALTGDNGAGKTTLARHLVGLVRPQIGDVRLLGRPIAGCTIGQIARLAGFAFQNPELQIFSPTVREEIAFGPRNLGMAGDDQAGAVSAAISRFGLRPVADYPPAVLSFSTRRMVALASIAAMQTPILVVDEPTVGLDPDGQERVMGWLLDRHRSGATILLITHDMELVAACAERVLVMERGRITADGDPGAVFAQQETLARAGLVPPFAVRFAGAIGRPELAADLTPQGAAYAWLECLS
jgi:energy-coupling factor transport system ATP-binding protein